MFNTKYYFVSFQNKIRTKDIIWLACKSILLLFSITLVLLIRIISPLILIRFGSFYTSRIGHFSQNVDIYLTERELGFHPPHSIDIFYYSQRISNYQLKKMWERSKKLHYWHKSILSNLILANKLIPGGDKHSIQIPLVDTKGVVPDWPPHIFFERYEEDFGSAKLREFGVPEDSLFICFHNRDSAYQNTTFEKGEDTNYHDYRNSNISNYLPAINKLTQKGYYAIRMGAVVKDTLTNNSQKIIDYSVHYRSDFMDIYLLAKCYFFIASPTGIIGIPIIFRKPQVIVNYIPFQMINIPAFHPDSLVILKKLWYKNEKRFLTFREMSKVEVDIHYKGNYYESINIEPIENTSEEILDVTMEMDDKLNGTWQTQKEDEELQNIFWSFFPSIAKKSGKKYKYSFRIGAEYLRKNKDLLKY